MFLNYCHLQLLNVITDSWFNWLFYIIILILEI